MVLLLGSKAEMVAEEGRLEKEAADRSFQVHGDSMEEDIYALCQWRLDGKISIVSSSKIRPADDFSKDMTGKIMQAKWKKSWLEILILATGWFNACYNCLCLHVF